MEEEGLIVEVQGKMAKVQIQRSSACGHCHACELGTNGMMIAEVQNPVNARVGEKVKIEIAPSSLLQAAFMVYIVPIIGLVVGYLIGSTITHSESIGICSGVAMLLLSFFILYWYDKKISKHRNLRPKIVQVVSGQVNF